MPSDDIRKAFLHFFEKQGHKVIPSSPLVLPWDPTVLFTTAGMQQFKPYFEGRRRPPARRLTSVQKCFRTSDIDKVGDASHLTFFEMLGNFSIGDYFKAEAIAYAWEFVTSPPRRGLGLPREHLWTAVFLDDDEAFDLWRKQGVPAERIRRYGEEDNYWFSGEVGPCGPCSEIYFDFGPQYGCRQADCEPVHDCGRFLEIWNLVFMTYFQHPDGSRTPLPAKNIDTGAGLERMAAVRLFLDDPGRWSQRPPSAYETDLFAAVIKRIEELSGRRYGENEAIDRAMRIVAEHTRAATFLIGDERTPTLPSNEERGYAVRRIIRRAVYFGRRYLGLEEPFLTDVTEAVIRTMAGAYPELKRQREFVLDVLAPEEQRFEETLSRGLQILEQGLIPFHSEIAGIISPMVKAARKWVSDPSHHFSLGRVSQVQAQLTPLVASRVYAEDIGRELVLPGERWSSLTEGMNLLAVTAIRQKLDDFQGWLQRVKTGSEQFDGDIAGQKLDALESSSRTLTGEEIFILHDTYGFPMELTREIAREGGFSIDEAGFQRLMEEQRERARAAAKGEGAATAAAGVYASLGDIETAFVGYETLRAETAVLALLTERRDRASALSRADLKVGPYERVDAVEAPAEVEIILSETPFYPEGGGQVGDRGEIIGPQGRMRVEDTQRVAERLIVHRGHVVEGRIAVGDAVLAEVDEEHRLDTMRNHTGTHLLHAALRQVLGNHVRQSGSLVAPDRLRFDFTHPEALTPEQIAAVQRLVNEKIRANLPVVVRQTSFDQALAEGVLAFFGEAYGEQVRVVEVPEDPSAGSGRFSAELCGGTHCQRSGDIGFLLIVDESSIGAGLRRIEALTGRGAEEYVRQQMATLDDLGRRLGAPRQALVAKLEALLAEQESLRKGMERLEQALAQGGALARRPLKKETVDGITVSAEEVEASSERALRFIGDAAKKDLKVGVAVLGAIIAGKPMFLAVASQEAIRKGVRADSLIKAVAQLAGGSGGGRPDMALGGGREASKLRTALEKVPDLARQMLSPEANPPPAGAKT